MDIGAHEAEDVASPGLPIESIGEAEVHRRDTLAKIYLATHMNHYALQRRGYFDRPEFRIGVQIGVAELSGEGREGGGGDFRRLVFAAQAIKPNRGPRSASHARA